MCHLGLFDVVLNEHERRDLTLLLGVIHSGHEGWVDAAVLQDCPRLARLNEVGRRLLEGAVVAVPPPPPNMDFTEMVLRNISVQILLIVEYVGASSYFVRVW